MAVIGAGASGTLTASHLLRAPDDVARRVVLIERGLRAGRGLAYSTPSSSHLLNIPAQGMSAFADDPGHFVAWARSRYPGVTPGSFLPRRLFGDYLQSVLRSTPFSRTRSLVQVRSEATALVPRPDGTALVGLADGSHVDADRVVLALGNLVPANPPVRTPGFYASPRYVRDPWGPGTLDGIAGPHPVLLIGTGLTAVDVALSLAEAGQTGPIHAVSRHGLLPQAHVTRAPLGPSAWSPPSGTTARQLLRSVRAQVAAAEAGGDDWRAVVDGLRPATQQIWQDLPHDERRRFLRWLARLWEVHRHRMAPDVADAVASLVAGGQLVVRAARVSAFVPTDDGVDVTLEGRSGGTLRVGGVVNCTGAQADVTAAGDRLLDFLLVTGVVRPDPLGLGLDVTASGAVLGADGRPSPILFAIGALRRGQRWETTAIPEIRDQAADLARLLLSGARAAV